MNSDQVRATHEAVRAWLLASGDPAAAVLEVMHLPTLSTPHFACFLISRPGVTHASRRFVLSDGTHVLGSGVPSFLELLSREGVFDDAHALPAALIAELFCRLTVDPLSGPFTNPHHPALRYVDPEERQHFTLPAVTRTENGLLLTFWRNGRKPWEVLSMEVHVERNANMSSTVAQLGQAPARTPR